MPHPARFVVAPLTIERIAAICHDANRRLCLAVGDDSQLPWEDAPEWARESAILGVENIVQGRVTRPEQSHEAWMEHKLAEGWVYGPVKHAGEKTHPCLLPFDELPPEQQAKDHLFFAIVTALTAVAA